MDKVKEGVQHKHCREPLLPRGGTVHLVQQLDRNVACLAIVICVLECRLCAVRPHARNNWLIKYGGCTTPPLDHQTHGTVVSDQSWRVGVATMETIMSARAVSQVVCSSLLFAMIGLSSPDHAQTQEELVTKIEAAGYSQVRDVKSTAEGISAKAMKNGNEVALVIDSTGQVKEKGQDH
jgi:hypothetical protein